MTDFSNETDVTVSKVVAFLYANSGWRPLGAIADAVVISGEPVAAALEKLVACGIVCRKEANGPFALTNIGGEIGDLLGDRAVDPLPQDDDT